MGEFLRARELLESAINLYDPERHRPLIVHYSVADVGVRCLSYVALTLWQLGYPNQALERGNEALARTAPFLSDSDFLTRGHDLASVGP